MNTETRSGWRIGNGYWAIIWTGLSVFTYAIRPVPVGYMFLAMFFAVLLYVMAPTIFQPIRIDALLIFVMGPQIIVWPDNGIAFGVIAGACVATAGIHALYYWFGSMNSMGNTDPE